MRKHIILRGNFSLSTEKSKTALSEEKDNSSQILSYGGFEYKHQYEQLMSTKTTHEPSVRITAIVAFAVFFTVVVVALVCLLIINIIIADSKNHVDAALDYPNLQTGGETLAENSVQEQVNALGQHATVSVTAGNDELTGIFVTSDGYIVTGGAPCLDAENVYVQIAGEKLEANVLGVNKNRNIAVLKVDSKSHTAADFGYGERINIGDEVFVAYNCANGHKVLKGSISVVEGGSVSVSGIGFENVMHGAAVIDGNGRVIGIVTHGNSGSLCAVSSSFAISTIRQFVKDAIQISSSENKKIEWLGVSVIQVTDDESKRFGLPGGVMILKTERLSLAEHIGLLPNDIIIGAESFAVNSVEKLDDIVSRYNGKSVSLLVYRNERYININLDVDN